VRLFVMGRDEWRDFDVWPPSGYRPERWHLHPSGVLAPEEPEPSRPTTYRYDPADPTPSVGGVLLGPRTGGRKDQGDVEARGDVTCFTSDVLARDVEIVGSVEAEIHASSTNPHFDVFVRLCDVNERGDSSNVCDGLRRVDTTRTPAGDDGVSAVRVRLWPTACCIRAGHRIRLQVASGAHPRYGRNLGTGDPIASGTHVRDAHVAIHHSPQHRSAVVLPVGS
jgi:putative CocE/NonD family hydrolase